MWTKLDTVQMEKLEAPVVVKPLLLVVKLTLPFQLKAVATEPPVDVHT